MWFENDQSVKKIQDPMLCCCILIWLYNLYPCLLNVLFPSSFPTKTLYAFLFSHICHIPCPSHPNNIWWTAQIMKLLIMHFPPVFSLFHPLWPKYLPQYSILKHLQLVFSPQCKKRSVKPIQNNMQNHSSVQSLHTDRQQMGLQKILSRMVAGTP